MLITPSLLTNSVDNLWEQIARLTPYLPHFQIDIVDGIFAPGTTITTGGLLTSLNKHQIEIADNHLVFDFHLMVKDYAADLENIREISSTITVDTVILHFGVHPDIENLRVKYPFKFALALNPDDTVDDLISQYPTYQNIHGIQIMAVRPGKQGQAFMPETLNKIEQLRIAGYRNSIYLDGGINQETLPIIFSQKYPPDVIGPGSFFSAAENVEERVKFIQDLSKE